MNGFILRERGSGLFVDRWGKRHSALPQAHIFPTSEEAEFYRLTLSQPDRYEICALNPEGVPIILSRD
jgi:hypothetical protein